jgi:hypothetical protein
MTTDFIAGVQSAAAALREASGQFTPEEFGMIPFEGSWSAAQVAEHVLKSASGIPVVLRGQHMAADRDPEQEVNTIRSIFLDLDNKMKSPGFILPSDKPPGQKELLSQLDDVFEKIMKYAGNVNLADLFTDFPFPQMGLLTGYEWLCFITCHTERHTVQVNNIYKRINEVAGSVS